MVGLIDPNTEVIDFGCGTGDFLLKLSHKIKYGLGIDKSKNLIAFANKKKQNKNLKNIDYIAQKATLNFNRNFNYSTASLFFHVLPIQESISILNYMGEISNHILICGFCEPKTLKQKLLLWFDQRFTGHYKHYKSYQQNGYLSGIIGQTKFDLVNEIETFDPSIKIYKIKTNQI